MREPGRVSLPNVPLKKTDFLYATYTPQVMSVSVNRDDTGSTTTPGYEPVTTTVSNTYSPVAFLDRVANPRSGNGKDPVDRMWVFYRKSDPTASSASSALKYKTMRLMVRIPNYVPGSAITAPKASEIDKVRGVAFYTQDFEGDTDKVNGNVCRIAWRDEGTINPVQTTDKKTGKTTIELVWNNKTDTLLPTDSEINEGQVTAFKDPIQDKVWVFWTSARNGMSDLYYETISPQFYAAQNY